MYDGNKLVYIFYGTITFTVFSDINENGYVRINYFNDLTTNEPLYTCSVQQILPVGIDAVDSKNFKSGAMFAQLLDVFGQAIVSFDGYIFPIEGII